MITDPIVLAALQQDIGRLLVLIYIDWQSGPVYVHSRVGQKRWDDKTWLGVGELGQISGLAAGMQVGQFTLILNSPDISLLNETNQDNVVGRSVKVYLAAMDEHRRIIATNLVAYKFISSVANKPGKVHQVSIECGGPRDRFKSAKTNARFSSAAWREKYPDDSYCDELEALAKGPLSSYSGNQSVGSSSSGGGRSRGSGARYQQR